MIDILRFFSYYPGSTLLHYDAIILSWFFVFKGRAGFATSPLLPDEIANVRERLLDFFMNEVIDIGGSCRVEGASYN